MRKGEKVSVEKKLKVNGAANRRFCDCGRPAEVVLCNARVCQRCYNMDHGKRYHNDGLKPQPAEVYRCSMTHLA